MSSQNERSSDGHVPNPEAPEVPELEADQTVPPRPEEEIADVLRAKPDGEDGTQQPE